MNIIVCLKQVVDTNLPMHLTEDGKSIDFSKLTFVTNPYDEYALEEALRIREKFKGRVIVITVGPSRAEEMLRSALALGVDEAIHVVDEHCFLSDPLVTAHCLADVISGRTVDLILCGRQAVDDDAYQVGPALSLILGIALVTLASSIKISEDATCAYVQKVFEGGIQVTLKIPIPCVITADKGLNEPRYATLPGIMAARGKPIQRLECPSREVSLHPGLEIQGFEIPAVERRLKIFNGDPKSSVREVVRLLKEEAKVF